MPRRPGNARVKPSPLAQVPEGRKSCSVEIAYFTVYTLRVGTEVRGDIFPNVTH